MKIRRFWTFLLVCVLMFGCSAISIKAVDTTDDNMPILRVAGKLNQSIPANSTVTMAEGFYLTTGDSIKYDCTYTPKSSSVDFGYIAPNGLFYSLNSTSGSINKSIIVGQTGQFTLAIRNNESYAVIVTGTVRY